MADNQDVKQSKKVVLGTDDVPGVDDLVQVVRGPLADAAERGDNGLISGLENIASMSPTDPKRGLPQPIPGTGGMVAGRMAFRRYQKGMQLAVAGGTAPLFNLPLDKLILMVERMHEEKRRTVIVQNCSEGKESEFSKGQILARINPKHSALHVIWGHFGKVISDSNEIAKQAVYYLDRLDVLFFYLGAKAQLKGGDELEALLQANEGWREYSIPTSPLDPGAA